MNAPILPAAILRDDRSAVSSGWGQSVRQRSVLPSPLVGEGGA